jgi:hypothetical protein
VFENAESFQVSVPFTGSEKPEFPARSVTVSLAGRPTNGFNVTKRDKEALLGRPINE